MVRPFTLGALSEGEVTEGSASGRSTFVTFLDGDTTEAPPPEQLDVEAQSRKVFEDAFVQGEKAGFEMGLKKVEPLVKRLNTYLGELTAFRAELAGRYERLAVELGLLFARTIILRECEERRDTVVEMAKRALEMCEDKRSIVIRMRREDLRHVAVEELSPLQVVADDTLKEPGFIIETECGDIDGRLSTQLEELTRRILNGCEPQ